MANWIVKDPKLKDVYWPSQKLKREAWQNNPKIYEKATRDPIGFWADLAKKGLEWFKEWRQTYEWKPPYVKWFLRGELNACYNALDRHVRAGKGKKTALIWVPEPPEAEPKFITYEHLLEQTQRFANTLKELGIEKGDRVGIYLPLIPELYSAMLACTRIGAVHTVVFSAFAPEALRVRLEDAGAKLLVTCDGYYRRGKLINLKSQADEGIEGTGVKKEVVVRRAGNPVPMLEGRDYWWHELVEKAEAECEPEPMDSEQMMFLLYTSGTTGKPKGVIHSTGGYLTQAYWTTKWVFDLKNEDVFWCTSDIGWITGHTYACYGPLLNGATMLSYEGALDYPEPDRWWEIIEKFKVTVFYTAPTAIRMFIKLGERWPKRHDLSSLRLLGTVGEPIDKDAWLWYFKVIGEGRCPITDTWWQTESGGSLIMSLPGVGPFIPCVAGRSFPGTSFKIVDEDGKETESGYLVQEPPMAPGFMRGLYRADEKYRETYWNRFRNKFYFTADGSLKVPLGLIRITGRVDDVMKVAGHRLASAEIEDAVNSHGLVSESAVIAKPHPVKGEVPVVYAVLKPKGKPSPELEAELKQLVREKIGPTATPEQVIFTPDLPKTRSGKIMRRILKALLVNAPIGDTSTLLNPEVVVELRQKVGYKGYS